MMERIRERCIVYEKKWKWVAQKGFKHSVLSLIEKPALKEQSTVR